METSMNSRSQSVPSSVNSSINRAKSTLNEASSEVSGQVGEWATQIRDVSSEYIEEGRKFVRENPAQGAGIAAAVGAVIGCLATLAFSRD